MSPFADDNAETLAVSPSSSDSLSEQKLPQDLQPIRSPSPSTSSSSSNDSEASNATVVVLYNEKLALKKDIADLQEKLSECTREMTLANNLRIKYREKVQALEKQVMKLQTENSKLIERNDCLQDQMILQQCKQTIF